MRCNFVLLGLFFVLLSFAQTASDFYKVGLGKYMRKDYSGAAVSYSQAISVSPKSSVLYNNRGLCYNKLEQWDKAAGDFSKAIELDPKNKEAYLNKGNLHKSKKEMELAAVNFYKALELDSSYSMVYPNLAFTLISLKDYKESVKYFTYAINSSKSENSRYYNGRGAAYSQMGKLQRAINDYNKALEINPKSYQSYINRGILKTRQKQYEDAIDDYTTAQSFSGFKGVGYYYRGLCRIDQLGAIRQSKEKHMVLDIKENKKLIDLACSDFAKAKTFSYGPSFNTYQEYCVEDVTIDLVAKRSSETSTESDSAEDTIKPSESIENTSEIETLTLTKEQVEMMKAEMKKEILEELKRELGIANEEPKNVAMSQDSGVLNEVPKEIKIDTIPQEEVVDDLDDDSNVTIPGNDIIKEKKSENVYQAKYSTIVEEYFMVNTANTWSSSDTFYNIKLVSTAMRPSTLIHKVSAGGLDYYKIEIEGSANKEEYILRDNLTLYQHKVESMQMPDSSVLSNLSESAVLEDFSVKYHTTVPNSIELLNDDRKAIIEKEVAKRIVEFREFIISQE